MAVETPTRQEGGTLLTLEQDPDQAAQLCRQAQARLTKRVAGLSDEDMVRPSALPGWTIAHVLTHLARNADAHARRLAGALAGQDVPKYINGEEQRRQEITSGSQRPAAEILVDLSESMAQLEALMTQSSHSGWPNSHFLGGGNYGVAASPAHRLREVEMHHVDLGLGYSPLDWPEEYVNWDLEVLLASVPDRLDSASHKKSFMAWLAGRGPLEPDLELLPW